MTNLFAATTKLFLFMTNLLFSMTKLAFCSNNYFLPRPHLPWLTKLFIHVKFICCHGKTIFIHDKVSSLQPKQLLFAVAKLFFHEKRFRDVTNFRVVSKLLLGHDKTFYESWQNSLIHNKIQCAIMTIFFMAKLFQSSPKLLIFC